MSLFGSVLAFNIGGGGRSINFRSGFLNLLYRRYLRLLIQVH